MRNLCRPKQLEIETYFNRLQGVYNTYQEQHNPIMGHYRALREKDDFYQRDIARNDQMIEHAEEILANLQNEWTRTIKTMGAKLDRMVSRKEELARRYWQMKKESKATSNKDNDKLTVLVNSSQDAIKRLEEVKEKINKINLMYQICSKYENEELDVLGSSNGQWIPQSYETLDEAMIEECKEYMKMGNFLLKVNRVKVQTICLRAEKAKLAKENVQLKHYIKKYLTELALKDGKDRPMSLKPPRMQYIDDDVKMHRPVTCIEGALSNAVMYEKRMKLQERRDKETGGIRSYPRINCW
ncbi:unnamed protein product, partial [Iphiclides podalirius]